MGLLTITSTSLKMFKNSRLKRFLKKTHQDSHHSCSVCLDSSVHSEGCAPAAVPRAFNLEIWLFTRRADAGRVLNIWGGKMGCDFLICSRSNDCCVVRLCAQTNARSRRPGPSIRSERPGTKSSTASCTSAIATETASGSWAVSHSSPTLVCWVIWHHAFTVHLVR